MANLNPLKRKQKVVATIDLLGVPEGTEGKIRVANGIEWFRYWVDFDNGMKLGRVDHNDVVKVEDWEQYQIDRANAELEPEVSEDQTSEETVSADSDSSAGNEHGIPEHLLERSRLARERLGA
ncbi:MAG: hypothetical protein VX476_02130 [Actinomycetota bacterium]|nr:hypothetical protein [Actinomycetota bacterium]